MIWRNIFWWERISLFSTLCTNYGVLVKYTKSILHQEYLTPSHTPVTKHWIFCLISNISILHQGLLYSNSFQNQFFFQEKSTIPERKFAKIQCHTFFWQKVRIVLLSLQKMCTFFAKNACNQSSSSSSFFFWIQDQRNYFLLKNCNFFAENANSEVTHFSVFP